MLPARSRSGDRTPFADTDFSKARGVHHHSRPSSPRSLENRAVAAIWGYCATKTGSVVVSSSGAVEDDAGFNESSKNSISSFWIHSQYERNRIELMPSTGGVKVVLHGDIRELISPKPRLKESGLRSGFVLSQPVSRSTQNTSQKVLTSP